MEAEYTDALLNKGYECDIAESRNFFLNEEVLLALSLLNSIDNPGRDVYLTALMTSPLFDFSFDELLSIKRIGDKDTLFASLLAYSKERPEDEKARNMICTLERYRKISEGMSVDAFITKLYKETGLLTLAAANGRRDNLMLLYSHARRYEKSSFKGLHSFIAYLNSVIENDGEFVSGESLGSADGKITILTYHRSKGLEFPIVIMTETQKRLYIADKGASARVRLAPDFGFSVGVREPGGLAMLRNPLSEIIAHYKRGKEFEEALRVLYVALTRARERLYIFGTAKDADKLIERCTEEKEFLSKYTVSEMQSMLDIIISCRDTGTIVCKTQQNTENNAEIDEDKNLENFKEAEPTPEKTLPRADEELCSEVLSRFAYEYPLKAAPYAPEKLAVSRLSPSLFDLDDASLPLQGEGDRFAVVGVDTASSPITSSLLPLHSSLQSSSPVPHSSSEEPAPTLPTFMTGNSSLPLQGEGDRSAVVGVALVRKQSPKRRLP